MKRLILISLLVFAVFSFSATSAYAQGRTHNDRQQVYNRFAERQDLAVAIIDGFKLNDTVKVDVLIIVADNDKAWNKLCTEFDIRSQKGVSTWTGKGDRPETRQKWLGKPACKAFASPAKKTICLYYIDNDTEYECLMDYQMDLMSKKSTKNK